MLPEPGFPARVVKVYTAAFVLAGCAELGDVKSANPANKRAEPSDGARGKKGLRKSAELPLRPRRDFAGLLIIMILGVLYFCLKSAY